MATECKLRKSETTAGKSDWKSFKRFQMVAKHRFHEVMYHSFLRLPSNNEFKDYSELNYLCHITTIETASKILEDKVSYQCINDFSVVKEYPTHPLHTVKVIWLSPSDNRIKESRYGNVSFSAEIPRNLIDDYKFYYVEFLKYTSEFSVRVLLTKNVYNNLPEFDPRDQGNAIKYEDGSFSVANRSGSSLITVEVITDSIFHFSTVNYVKVEWARPLFVNNKAIGHHPCFTDDSIGYLFYNLVIHANKHRNNLYKILLNDSYPKKLKKQLREVSLHINERLVQDEDKCKDDVAKQSNDEKEDNRTKREEANKLVQSLKLGDIESSATTAAQLYQLFKSDGIHPDPIVCIDTIHKRLAENMKSDNYLKKTEFNSIIEMFLRCFSEKEDKVVRARMVDFVRDMHK